ncbi:MAG: hypothetical protein K2L42_05355 [Clostridia bacterium]|nr:hypothetical protein [Clostridia bacterium]
MISKFNASKFSVVFYWLLVLAMLALFFTNDFGLVDLHKTAIITAVGIDVEGEEVKVTCEIAVPQPSQSGDNIKYTQIQGSGLTIADALNEVNSKTGFYPQLQFCKLILIGESVREHELFRVLGCFYRKNYSELTALVAMCQGKASDMLSLKSPVSDMTSEAIRKALSEEIEKSANATSVNLKDIAMSEYSKSYACYMPYVEANIPGTSESGGNGDNVGGEGGNQGSGNQQGSQNSGQQSGAQGPSEGGGSSEGGSAQNGATQQSGSEQQMEFTARKTAMFSNGKFKGLLNDQQAFALAVIEDEIRLAVLPCDADGVHYTLGLKNISCGVGLKVENGVPVLTVGFEGKAQIQGARVVVDPSETSKDDFVKENILEAANGEMQKRFEELLSALAENDCDLLGIRELLYKFNTKYYDAFKDDILTRMEVKYQIDIQSVN